MSKKEIKEGIYHEDLLFFKGKGSISPLNKNGYVNDVEVSASFSSNESTKKNCKVNKTEYPFSFMVHGLDESSKVKFSGIKYQRLLFAFHKVLQDVMFYTTQQELVDDLGLMFDDYVVGFNFTDDSLLVENVHGIDCYMINVSEMKRDNFTTIGLINELIDLAIKSICFMNFQDYNDEFIKAYFEIRKICNWYLSDIASEIRPILKSNKPHKEVNLLEKYELY